MPGLGMQSRCRPFREGRVGRYHTYTCRNCDQKFRIFLLRALPRDARYCMVCRQNPEINARVERAMLEREQKEAL
jgi:hypothetical protein